MGLGAASICASQNQPFALVVESANGRYGPITTRNETSTAKPAVWQSMLMRKEKDLLPMKKAVLALAALTIAAVSSSGNTAPPYSVTATFDPASGATSYRLYQGCQVGETKALLGPIVSGQTLNGVIPAAGTYSFCVHGVNAAGEGPRSNIQVVNISDVIPPGAPSNFQIVITCAFLPDGVTPSCTFTVTNVP